MSEEQRICVGVVRYKGIFNLNDLNNFLYDWCMDEQYKIQETKNDEQVSGDTKSLEVKWNCDRKITDYFRLRIKLKWVISDLKKIEVKRGGQRLSMNSGNLGIKFTGLIFTDYQGRWETMPFWKFFRGFYDRFIIRNRVEEYEKMVEADMNTLINETKAFLNVEKRRI